MNLVADAPFWLFVLLIFVLAAAAIEDAVRLRISNLTCLAVVAVATMAVVFQGFSPAFWQNAAVFFLILGLGTAAFAAGMLGGGDVKLLAALGLSVNFRGAVALVSAVFLAGGVLALLYLASRAIIRANSSKTRRIPYGVAIAMGAVLAFGLQRGDLPSQKRGHPLSSFKILPLRH
jgi:prepilin peptidase CpaA